MDNRGLVTIITPVYNAQKHIDETIKSVLKQTYSNWEWFLIDDLSSDASVKIIEKYVSQDDRIHLRQNKKNSGAAESRNKAIQLAHGEYIAFLDADDLWTEQKLEKQVSFMVQNEIAFSCASYEVISDKGKKLNKKIIMPRSLNYDGFLKYNILQTVGIMVNIKLTSKDICFMPNIRRRQDAATWLNILRHGYKCYGLDEVLGMYRRTEGSLSSNKFKAVKGIWFLYRKIEKLTLPAAIYYFSRYAILAVWKRMYTKNKG